VSNRSEHLRISFASFRSSKPLQKTKNSDLFEVDVKGDESVRKRLLRFSTSELTSAKILAQRSAVPAVISRTTSTNTKKRKSLSVSHEDKARLLRVTKRLRRGPLNSYIDPTQPGQGSALMDVSDAVRKSGRYDAWADAAEEKEEDSPLEGMEQLRKKKIKPPVQRHPREDIQVPAIHEPHQGTSYNPVAGAHNELLLKAHQAEERRVREEERLAELQKKMHSSTETTADGLPSGMTLDTTVEVLESDDDEEDEEIIPVQRPERKTKQQRKKAEKRLAEKRLLAEKAARKRLNVDLDTVKALRLTTDSKLRNRAKLLETRKAMMRQKLRQGLAGKRIGRHKVPEREIEVQLGEQLSESLRTLQPEGNLFKDRLQSLQERAMIEPRVRVLPSKRRTKDKVYEKHAWKRFM
jgi:nucleolar protein 53